MYFIEQLSKIKFYYLPLTYSWLVFFLKTLLKIRPTTLNKEKVIVNGS